MFFFKKIKSRSLSFHAILGFEYEKVNFSSVFPEESYDTTSLAVSLPPNKESRLVLLDNSAGPADPVFNTLLDFKKAELQRLLQQQRGSIRLDSAWGKPAVSAAGDAFIYLSSQTGMADILDLVFQSQVKQQRSILVNFELDASLNRKPARLSALINRGVYFQVSFLSLLGLNGQLAKRTAYHLLLTKRVAFLGMQIGDFEKIGKAKEQSLSDTVVRLLDQQETISTDLSQLRHVHGMS